MSWYWILLPAIIWITIMISPVVLNVQVKKRGKDERYDLGIHLLWGLINFDFDIPKILFDKNKVKVEAEVEQPHKEPIIDKEKRFSLSMKLFMEIIFEIVKKREYILKKLRFLTKITRRLIKLDKFHWEIEYGVEDAALTGVLYGFIWQGVSTILLIFSKTVNMRTKPKVKVYPEFNRYFFKTELNCIFRLRVGYIIIISMFFSTMVLKYKLSQKLGGGKGVRASNSRANENSNGKYKGNG